MTAETVWERVDLPVLRFVADLDYSLRWRFETAVRLRKSCQS